MAELSTQNIDDLPDADFAYIEDGGTKDGSGKTTPRSLRHFPIHDKAHVANALSRAPQSPFGKEAMPKIEAAAKKFGVDDENSGRSEPLPLPAIEFSRSFPVELSYRGTGGRTVDAYAAGFNVPYRCNDQDGEYLEELDPRCFDRVLDHIRRSKAGFNGIPVMFNHGMTIFHTPSDLDAMPIGVCENIEADSTGLLTTTRYLDTQRANETLENMKAGSIRSYSFSGAFQQSSPDVRRTGKLVRDRKTGKLPTLRRLESSLREYGPTPFPANDGANVVAIRALAGVLSNLTSSDRDELAALIRRSGSVDEIPELQPGTPDDSGPATDDPPKGLPPIRHSIRSPREELQARRAQFLIRHGGDQNA